MTTSSTGTSAPVVRIRRHRSRACGELLAAVDEDQVDLGGLEQGAALGGEDLDLVAEQREPGQHLGGGLEGAGQQQQLAHRRHPSRRLGSMREGYPVMSTPPDATTPD